MNKHKYLRRKLNLDGKIKEKCSKMETNMHKG